MQEKNDFTQSFEKNQLKQRNFQKLREVFKFGIVVATVLL